MFALHPETVITPVLALYEIDGVTSYAYELNISAPTTVTIVATQAGSAILALYKYVFKIS